MRHGMKVQIVTLFHVSHLQRYGITEHGNITSVYPPSEVKLRLQLLTQNNTTVYYTFHDFGGLKITKVGQHMLP
jgi:hypothetical protein